MTQRDDLEPVAGRGIAAGNGGAVKSRRKSASARAPPLWDDFDAHAGEGSPMGPDWATRWDEAAQPAPTYQADQRINW